MSDNNKKLLYYGLAGFAAVAIIGVGIWYASAEDEYENAKIEIAKMGSLNVTTSYEIGGQVLELE